MLETILKEMNTPKTKFGLSYYTQKSKYEEFFECEKLPSTDKMFAQRKIRIAVFQDGERMGYRNVSIDLIQTYNGENIWQQAQ